MRKRSVKQFAIVQGDSAQAFTDALNRQLVELEGREVKIDFYENFLGARIYWEQVLGEEPESLSEEYECHGIGFKCKQCPFYEVALNADGTVDGRRKTGRCMFKHNARVYAESKACEQLLKMIQEGDVELCLAEHLGD